MERMRIFLRAAAAAAQSVGVSHTSLEETVMTPQSFSGSQQHLDN